MPLSPEPVFPVSYSTISEQALLERLLPQYAIPPPIDCTFLRQGLNDTYLVKTADGPSYILRIYRHGWRTLSDISYEVDALLHLMRNAAPVSAPLAGADGEVIRVLPAPEGHRYAVLFTHAAGRDLLLDKHDAFHLGQSLAMLHTAAQQFDSLHSRSALDWGHLIDTPLRDLAPILARRREDWNFLQAFADWLRQELTALNPSDKGFCHGDAHELNAAISGDTVTWFDFDCCGNGWRAYDLAIFRWSARWQENEEGVWKTFLRGYEDLRSLSEADLRAVPLFIGIRNVWLMGLNAGEARRRGCYGLIKDAYLDRHLTFLRKCEKDYLAASSGEPPPFNP
jgi:Ser/Thr protein kinase RdoA (MazF antagonist)